MESKTVPAPLPVSAVNHFSLLCSSVEESAEFYERVLGFIPIKRPGSFDFDGAWLYNYGFGIHLIQSRKVSENPKKREINPKDNHMSFQTACQDVDEIEQRLEELGVSHKRVQVKENGILVDQIFFHDPDGFMIEVCTCDNLPVVPLKSAPNYATFSSQGSHTSFVCSQQYKCYPPPSSAAICGSSLPGFHD